MKIAAVVVTYNRLELLKECISALKNQTYKLDEIIIVNNCSTDGTLEWLSEQKDLTTITQENVGGAGGFYTGIKVAYEKGYDWIWCMDDDGRPVKDTLEELLKYAIKEVALYHPLVLDYDNETFSFGCWFNDGREKLLFKSFSEIKKTCYFEKKIFPSLGTPFNGTLIPRKAVELGGYPNPKYFIWGDESEYIKRIVKKGFKSFNVVDAIFNHPYNKYIFNIMNLPKKDFWKVYYLYRNKKDIIILENKCTLLAIIKYIKQNIVTINYIFKNIQEDKTYKIKIILIATLHALLNKYGKYSKL